MTIIKLPEVTDPDEDVVRIICEFKTAESFIKLVGETNTWALLLSPSVSDIGSHRIELTLSDKPEPTLSKST